MSKDIKYGVINEDYFTLITQRSISGDAHDLLSDAFEEAFRDIDDGCQKVSIVRCFYSEKQDCWYEHPDGGCIQIEAHNWVDDDDFREALEAARKSRALAKMAKKFAPGSQPG